VIAGNGRYLFPHRDKPDAFATPARLRYLMRDLNIAKGASPHCWRTTFSTWANENGHRPDAIEKQLAHVESNKVRATYNKALLVEERRQIMQAWATIWPWRRQRTWFPCDRRRRLHPVNGVQLRHDKGFHGRGAQAVL